MTQRQAQQSKTANVPQVVPRFLTDAQLMQHFGLSERALQTLRMKENFPPKDAIINRTDRVAVERFFDRRSGIYSPATGSILLPVPDGEENFA